MNRSKKITSAIVAVLFMVIVMGDTADLQAADVPWAGVPNPIPNDGNVYYVDSPMALSSDLHIYGTLEIRPGGFLGTNGTSVVINDGSINNSSGSAFINNGSFGGSGNVTGNFTNENLFMPGSSPGVMTINGTYVENASLVIELEGSDGSVPEYDYVNVLGDVVLGISPVLDLDFFGSFDESYLNDGDFWDVVRYTGSRSGVFSGIDGTNAPLTTGFWSLYYDIVLDSAISSVRLTYTVPEPVTLALLLLGGLALLRRRK